MKIGFLMSDYASQLVEFAGKAGFDCLEIFTFPGGQIDLNSIQKDEFERINENLRKNNVFMGTLACSLNHLDGDPVKRKENNAYFRKAIESCGLFTVNTLCSNVWANFDLSPAENIALYKEVFSEYAKIAEDNGVRIALENCPHSDGYPIKIKNIAHSPEMWEILFNEVPSKVIGLEFDPSHLYWQQINIEKAILNFGNRIYAFHAKDTETVKDKLDQCGIYGKMLDKKNSWDFGVWRYRIPGWGDINWKSVFRRLVDIGYRGPVCIEHEDPVFQNQRFEEGLKLGLQFLRQFEL